MAGHPLGVYATRQDPAQLLEDMKRAAVEQLGRVPDGLYLAKIEYDDKWGLPQEKLSPLPWF